MEMFVVKAKEMRDLDLFSIERMGIPGPVLMENAARGAFCVLQRCFPDWRKRRIAVFCGRGNNGGDGLVLARYILERGGSAQVFLTARLEDVTGDARFALESFLRTGGELSIVGSEGGPSPEGLRLSDYGLIVDALLGTGLQREVREPLASIIRAMNSSQVPVLSVDIPSGLCSDTGRPLGIAVEATVTVTFAFPKLGHFLYPGRKLSGELYVVDIGIPRKATEELKPQCLLVTPQMLKGALRPREPDSHKGNFGHVLVIAGSAGKTGAGVMASEAALRVGAGLVTMAVPKSLNLAMEARLTEVMTLPLPEGEEQSLSLEALDRILEELGGKNCVALGPGISTLGETPALAREIARRVPLPMVIDADGLNALVGHLEELRDAPSERIITPHPGEMSRLLGCSVREVQEDRLAAALKAAKLGGCCVVLKGAGSVIADPQGNVRLVPTGNPAMASGGMGDVLTGMIAGLLAQGMKPMDAASLGTYVHGWMGDMWAAMKGKRGLAATDLIAMIPESLETLLEGKAPRTWPKEMRDACCLYM